MRTLSPVAALLVMVACSSRAGIIDRIAVSVDKQVITESEIVQQIRIAAFLNRTPADTSAAGKRKAAEQLVELALIAQELKLSPFIAATAEEVSQALDRVKADYTSETGYRERLASLSLTEAVLERQLRRQIEVNRLIDYRFRPATVITDADVQEYYDRKVEEWTKQGVQPIPSLAAARGDIEKILSGQQANQALDKWLGEVRIRANILYHDEALK